jgi:hypothetical protein
VTTDFEELPGVRMEFRSGKSPSLLVLLFTGAIVACSAPNSPRLSGAAVTPAMPAQARETEFSRIDETLSGLSSRNAKEREGAKNAILTTSGKSEELRRYIIGRLLKITALPNGCIEVLTSEQRWLEWREATDILGTMKTPETTDVLVGTLDCSTGTSLSTDAYPATKAIIKLGHEAVPKLGEALELKPVRRRFMAAQALYGIGGEGAKHALQKAAQNEKDERVRRMIKDMLRDWDYSGKNRP